MISVEEAEAGAGMKSCKGRGTFHAELSDARLRRCVRWSFSSQWTWLYEIKRKMRGLTEKDQDGR